MILGNIGKKISTVMLGVASIFPLVANADGGVTLGSTRIIYPLDSKQMSVSVKNTSDKTSFLVQSWVEDSEGKKVKSFITTPPLFKSAPNNENLLRLMYAGEKLPEDRESLFYFNAKAIPAIDKDDTEGRSALILATVTRIKLFVRPEKLPLTPEKAKDMLRFSRNSDKLTIINPSPYYLTLSGIKLGSQSVETTMVPPKDKIQIKVPTNSGKDITYSIINDFGGVSEPQKGIYANNEDLASIS
ncbi:fimbria/pilus periplasmic chaperone [Acinetobacter terrestris]|uniref:fimbria/pilus periplasmic chaperone n=1 Tax=Acinetobacter terrestris TaxID=2529843 RepID=UPI003524E6F0